MLYFYYKTYTLIIKHLIEPGSTVLDGGANLGYIIDTDNTSTEIGVSFINAIDDAGGMQFTGAVPNTTFGGFGSFTNGSELVSKIPAFDAHLTMSFDRINII